MKPEPSLLRDWLEESRTHHEACILWSSGLDDAQGKWLGLAGFGARAEYYDVQDVPSTGLHLGLVSYEWKRFLHGLHSQHKPHFQWPECWMFQPKIWQGLDRSHRLCGDSLSANLSPLRDEEKHIGEWKQSGSKEAYLGMIERLRKHIIDGEFYELNYCVAFHAQAKLDPQSVFEDLVRVSPSPFACFVKRGDLYLMCSSPERFLQKHGQTLRSQPIKGTRKRSLNQSELEAQELAQSTKDRAENIMIVDLVRNDLSRVCKPGTVQVEELCKVYSFEHVHQMISTVSGSLEEGVGMNDIWRASFPMGSMTGAPKKTVMEHIDRYEDFARGLYSGSVGWMQDDCFDFNVVIRALQYEAQEGLLGYHVGGAITYDSVPESEYQECLDKASGLRSALGL